MVQHGILEGVLPDTSETRRHLASGCCWSPIASTGRSHLSSLSPHKVPAPPEPPWKTYPGMLWRFRSWFLIPHLHLNCHPVETFGPQTTWKLVSSCAQWALQVCNLHVGIEGPAAAGTIFAKPLLGLADSWLIAYLTLAAKVPSLATYHRTLFWPPCLRSPHKNLQMLVVWLTYTLSESYTSLF